MPKAARIGDMHACPKIAPGPVPHVGGPIMTGEASVLICGSPAARVSDKAVCAAESPDTINQGEASVLIGGQQAARIGDGTAHGGRIVTGAPTVLIGSNAQSSCLRAARASGAAFVKPLKGTL